jgi:hypothetical protein
MNDALTFNEALTSVAEYLRAEQRGGRPAPSQVWQALEALEQHRNSEQLRELYIDVLESLPALEQSIDELPKDTEAEKYLSWFLEKMHLRVDLIEQDA